MGKLMVLLLLASAAFGYPKTIAPASLVGHWTFDAVSGTTVQDSSGQGGTGTSTNITYVAGRLGNAARFDTDQGMIECTHKSAQLLTSGGTIVAWVNADTDNCVNCGGTRARIVNKGGVAGDLGYQLSMKTGTVFSGFVNNGAEVVSGPFSLSRWTHVVMTFTNSASASRISFFVNGQASGTPATSGSTTGITDTGPLHIGSFNGSATGGNVDGLIDDVRIYNRVLTLTEIQQLYHDGRMNH